MKQKENGRAAQTARGPAVFLLVEGRIHEVDVLFIHLVLGQTQSLAKSINMKWILKEPPTAFVNDIFKDAQYYCACLKVPLLLPCSLIYEVMRLFLRIFCIVHSLARQSHHLLTGF